MTWDKLDSNITNREVVHPERESVKKQDAEPKVVPVVQENDTGKTDLDKPIEGFCIYKENPPQEPIQKPDNEEDDDIDTSVNTEARISILPTVTNTNVTNDVTNAMKQAVNRAVTELFEKSSNNSFFKAQSMIQDNKVHQCFDELNYPAGLNIYGKVVYEGTKQKYLNSTPASESTYAMQTERADLGLNWKNKTGKTKAFVFGSYSHTKMNLDFESKVTNEKIISDTEHDNSFSVYGAAEHRFKNGDLLMGSASYIDDAVEFSRMTSLNAGYYLKDFNVLAEGTTTVFQLLDLNTVTKTDISISLNPELADKQPKGENTSSVVSESNQQIKNVLNANGKKWSLASSPFYESQTIGNTENGLGIKFRFKRTDDNSTLRLTTFGKASTTQQDENNQYHVTFGSGVKYAKNIGAKSLLRADAEIKDRYTLGHNNILTASAHAIYTSPIVSLEAEAKKILISGEQPSYDAIVGRGYYTPTKNVNLFAELSYTDYRDTSYKIKGTNLQIGVIFNY